MILRIGSIIFISIYFHAGCAIYFSDPEPVRIFRSNETIYEARGILEPDDEGRILYKIQNPTNTKCPPLFINPSSGNITLLKNTFPNPSSETCKYGITGSLQGQTGLRNKKQASANLSLIFTKKLNCSYFSPEEICFSGRESLELFVLENSEEVIGTNFELQNPKCSFGDIKYSVMSDGDEAVLIETSQEFATLKMKSQLDRESRETHTFRLFCEAVGKNSSIKGTLFVLDQDDNPPMTQEGLQHETISISLKSSTTINKFIPNERLKQTYPYSLFFYDFDSREVNKYEVLIKDDIKGLLSIEYIIYKGTKFDIYIPQIILTSNADSVSAWVGLYCVEVEFNDTTLARGHGKSSMQYTVCLHWGDDNSTILSPGGKEELPDKETIISTGVYEGWLNGKIKSKAPVLYPFLPLIRDKTDFSHFPRLNFIIDSCAAHFFQNDSMDSEIDGEVLSLSECPFDMTPRTGIIYLNNSEWFQKRGLHYFLIKASWTYPENYTLVGNRTSLPNIKIYMEDERIDEERFLDCEEVSCAEYSDFTKCTNSCGFGSRGPCSWKSPKDYIQDSKDWRNESDFLISYSSCTPLPATCPDSLCDELESVYEYLCPQDCAHEVQGFGGLIPRSYGKSHGINENGRGVCTCHDSRSCVCGFMPTDMRNDEEVAGAHVRSNEGDTCEGSCIILVSLSTIVLIALFALLTLFFFMKSRVSERRKKNNVGEESLLGSNGRILGDTSASTLIISELDYMGPRNNFSTFTQNSFLSHSDTTIEPKWEIPRGSLFLEDILGVGEFGRVLKGKVTGLRGREEAFIPVAVKMLKDNEEETGKSSKQEFLAEFSLLKQVDHPNVIKLLGVCTSPGGPLYLILEYAEFGSLRSFLRKCRRVENSGETEFSGSTVPSTPIGSDEKNYIVSPQEILQFSWQIARGMTYLSDMKMVHRDLAARNILLTQNKVCKISDFGLTRDIYVDEAYQKKSKDRVPVKWLAPESLADEIYTSKSDVWSFGILLWELSTLGSSPYPGIKSEQLYALLKAGYRMDQPLNCSDKLYGLMLECWADDARNRPTFRQISESISKLLEDGIEYLKFDLPFISNPGYELFSPNEAPSETLRLIPLPTNESSSQDQQLNYLVPNGHATNNGYMNEHVEVGSAAYEIPISETRRVTQLVD